jgi:O-antigen chain-terminating methyltransferase
MRSAATLDELSALSSREFVDSAYSTILDRPPTEDERARMLSDLDEGQARTWVLGRLRFGAEGRRRSARVSGLWIRYVAQRLFRMPVVGTLLEWMEALVTLPSSLRALRAVQCGVEREADALASLNARVTLLEQAPGDPGRGGVLSGLDAILPPPLGETLEVTGPPLVSVAKERCRVAPELPVGSLPANARYALFESVFYESPVVASKQRVYIPYLRRAATSRLPFLDLGFGRGEFLQILRNEGIEAIGVEVNAWHFGDLRTQRFEVVEQDLLTFLEGDRRTYSGASMLQVAEHLTGDAIERALSLVYARLAPGATIIVETPNTLSPFAMGVFHTDPTHVTPLPPERLRYAVEAAGFVETRTLFQSRIPGDQFAGRDPRAYYMDYAIIALRPLD